ncbi:predicted protein, partial [Nematostella vectensis]
LQEARLEVLQRILQEREEDHAELNTKRLDRLWSKKQKEKEAKFDKIQKEHIKKMRKLKEKRRTVEGKLERRDVVQDYSDFNSQTYAPMSRVGVFLDRGSEQYSIQSFHLSTYQGLLELEASLPDFVTQPRIQAPKPKSGGKAGFVKRTQRRQRELEEVADAINLAKRPAQPEKPLKFLVKVEKPVPRPPTPSVEIPSQELIRLQEERRIHAFAMLAERQRRIREAEESGRRQVEERRRREEDEIFKQVVKVHQNTVDTYLEDVIMGAIEVTAEDQ